MRWTTQGYKVHQLEAASSSLRVTLDPSTLAEEVHDWWNDSERARVSLFRLRLVELKSTSWEMLRVVCVSIMLLD